MNLRNCRLRKGITQWELAERVECTPSQISNWETGTTEPMMTSIVRLAEALDVTVGTLLLEETPLRVSTERVLDIVGDNEKAFYARTGIPKGRVRQWRRGKTVGIRTVGRIADAYGIAPSLMLEDDV